MSLLWRIFPDISSIVTSVIYGASILLVIYIVKFYLETRKYPPGPIPLPIVGNLLQLRGRWPHEACIELSKKYGPVFTLWFGQVPAVILATNDAILEAYRDRKNDFGGRPKTESEEMFKASPHSSDVIFTDWSPEWEVLRRVAYTAVRKFAANPELPKLEVAIIDQVVEAIKKQEGRQFFDPNDYLYLVVYSILASITAGQSYSIDDPEFLALKNSSQVQQSEGFLNAIVEFIPFTKYFVASEWKKLVDAGQVRIKWCREKLRQHETSYKSGQIRDFCDAILHSKEEAEEADSKAISILNEDNLVNVLMNLFIAGSDTTRITSSWAVLIWSRYPEIQRKLREEVDRVIGDEVPTSDHRLNCHYVQAFISEVMRFRPLVPMGLDHKAIVTSTVCGFKINKGTMTSALMYNQLNDPEIWDCPSGFRPERFIDPESGNYKNKINNAYFPFSLGRRLCIGEKLATVNLFVILTRLLQKTRGLTFELEGNETLDADPSSPFSLMPKAFKVRLVQSGE